MPEQPDPKIRPHPFRTPGTALAAHPSNPDAPRPTRLAVVSAAYAELSVTSNYTFLTGASHPEELVYQAAALGHRAVAIADTNTLAGIVRAHVAAKQVGIPLAIGCRLRLAHPDGLTVLVYPTDRPAYARLCRLLTLGKRRAKKGECRLTLDDLLDHSDGMLAVVEPPPQELTSDFAAVLTCLRGGFDDDRLSIAAAREYGQDDRGRLRDLGRLADDCRVPLAAVNNAHYHLPERRPLQDVLTCIRHGCTLDEAGMRLASNSERHLKAPEEIGLLFHGYADAIARSVDIALRGSAFSLDQLKYEYPDEVVPPGSTPMQHLAELTRAGMAERYPSGVPDKVRGQIDHELRLIEELNYAPYFLTVQDIVRFARSQGILCQGRGAAANSSVCYCLGVTSVDPARIDLLFERFVSKERNEPPDIDIDFEHERREEVIQYLYRKYGRDRAALTAVVTTYRGKSAVREVGKAMGLSLDAVDRLAKEIDWWDPAALQSVRVKELGFDPRDPLFRRVAILVSQIAGFPRHLSQHVGGFVLTRTPLSEMVPIENAAMEDRTVIQWDKDDIDAVGFLKVDCLGLGMLTCIRKGFALIEQHHQRPLTLATVPPEDPIVYDMICQADTIGTFQIESRAQMSMLPRLKPRCYYDLVIEVAIVRPGPIQGNMVHPYLRRRDGLEAFDYPNEEIKRVLSKTLGVPLFQEQAMLMAIVAGGFTPGEADELRRAMAAWKRKGDAIYRFGQKLISGMIERGYPQEFALNCFEQIKGFSEYGFPESHAASFALLVYVSCWLKRYYPAAFAAGLINSQPMGFYQPAQIVRDAKEHGVKIRPVDVNISDWDCTLEDGGKALRLGMRLVKGLPQRDAEAVMRTRVRHGLFRAVFPLWQTSRASVTGLRALARADAFGSMGLDRQGALWEVQTLHDEHLPLFDGAEPPEHPDQPEPPDASGAVGTLRAFEPEPEALSLLPTIPEPRKVLHDYDAVGLTLRAHPMSFIRTGLDRAKVVRARDLQDPARTPAGRVVAVAGVVLIRQRPGTASGIVFITLEDETGVANLIVRPQVYERYRRAARHSPAIVARGKVERQGLVVHVLVSSIKAVASIIDEAPQKARNFH